MISWPCKIYQDDIRCHEIKIYDVLKENYVYQIDIYFFFSFFFWNINYLFINQIDVTMIENYEILFNNKNKSFCWQKTHRNLISCLYIHI